MNDLLDLLQVLTIIVRVAVACVVIIYVGGLIQQWKRKDKK